MKKTNREWLSEMDEPERSEALENVQNYMPKWLNDDEGSIYNALESLFMWYNTPQGKKYWKGIAAKYRNR